MSDFIVAAAQDVANRTIQEAHIIRLAVDDQNRFAELIFNPPAPTPAMKRAKKAHTRLIRGSR